MHDFFGPSFETLLVMHAEYKLLAQRSRRRLSPCLRRAQRSLTTRPIPFGFSNDAVEDDPDEQCLTAKAQSVSCFSLLQL